jgi:phosphatidylglycerophosphatase A
MSTLPDDSVRNAEYTDTETAGKEKKSGLTDTLFRALASGFGVGYIPFASGTFGTLWGIPLFLLLHQWDAGRIGPFSAGPIVYFGGTILFILFSCWVSDRAESLFGEHDSGKVIIDEVAGFLVGMSFLPVDWVFILAGFIAFRFFDILKPFPIGLVDKKVGGGIGVVLDDLIAGIYACFTIWLVILVGGFL